MNTLILLSCASSAGALVASLIAFVRATNALRISRRMYDAQHGGQKNG